MTVFLEIFRENYTKRPKSQCNGGVSDAILNQYVMLPPDIQKKWRSLLVANVNRKEAELRLGQLDAALKAYNALHGGSK